MKIVIVGNGIAGQTIANSIIKRSNEHEIVMITREIHPYYSRIFLPQYITGIYSIEKLYQRKLEWYKDNGIKLFTGTIVENIDIKNKRISYFNGIISDKNEIVPEKNQLHYDKLVLSIGSTPRLIPFGNPNINGLFTLRTIADSDRIKEFIKENNSKRVFIIGGGLLGIELGFHLMEMGMEITICEIFPYLLPRQLDERTSALLKQYLKGKGIRFLLGKSVKKIIGGKHVEGVEMETGETIKTDYKNTRSFLVYRLLYNWKL